MNEANEVPDDAVKTMRRDMRNGEFAMWRELFDIYPDLRESKTGCAARLLWYGGSIITPPIGAPANEVYVPAPNKLKTYTCCVMPEARCQLNEQQ